MRYLSNKIFLFLIVCFVFFMPKILRASCNQSTDPNVFKIHGKIANRHIIEGKCFEEFLKAMDDGKDIDIKYAKINKTLVDITVTDNLFQIQGTEQNEYVIEGKFFEEFLKAMGEGKNVNIKYANIKENIDFTKKKIFLPHSLDDVKKFLNQDDITHISRIPKYQKSRIILIKGNLQIEGCIINGNIKTREDNENVKVVCIYEKIVSFKNTKFHGKEIFLSHFKFNEWANFSGTYFDSPAIFDNATFNAGACFDHSVFNAHANLKNSRFYAETSFADSIFDNGVDFSKTKFFGNSDFKNTLFGMKSTYAKHYSNDLRKPNNGTRIENTRVIGLLNERLDSKNKTIYSKINNSFSSVTFTKFVDFTNTFFFGDTDFIETKFKEVGLFDNAIFFNANIIGLAEDENKDPLISLNFDKSYFNILKGLTFNQIFPNLQKRPGEWHDRRNNNESQSIATYKYFQENFRKIGLREDADKIYYQIKLLDAENEKRVWKKYLNWFLDKTCRYGTDFKQIVKVSIILIISFTLLYFFTIVPSLGELFGVIEVKDKDQWIVKEKLSDIWGSELTKEQKDSKIIKSMFKHLWHSFYLSLNTFTTVGTGDIIATRILRVFVLIEGALGWFMLGLFVVVLSSKYFR